MSNKGVGEAFRRFSDELFPPPTDPAQLATRPTFDSNPFEQLKDAESLMEGDLTDRLIDVIESKGLAPGLKLCYCGNRPDPAMIDSERQKPDAAFYRAPSAPGDHKPHWADQLLPWEFKRGRKDKKDANLDPFVDGPGPADVSPAIVGDGVKSRGQIITYGECVMAVQQRLSVFMPVVIGRRLRFIRWDRSGSIVSQSFDYYEHWEFFCDILWRISQLSDIQLGIDPTAERILPSNPLYNEMDDAAVALPSDIDHAERNLAEGEVPEPPFIFAYVRKMFRDSLVEHWPRYRLQVPDGDEMKYFLVCKPGFRATGLAGRGTRGYVAFDCGTKRFVWLKDAWRAHYLMVEKEGDVLAQLNKAKVSHVPTLVCHGDIDNQDTLTPSWWERKQREAPSTLFGAKFPTHVPPCAATTSSYKRKRDEYDDHRDERADTPTPKGLGDSGTTFREDCPMRLHRHYRLVVAEVALPLKEFSHGRQLVSIIKDCVHAHWKASEVNILHRDVSGGNILILPTCIKKGSGGVIMWMGMLADWEMSKPLLIIDGPRKPRQPERTGTWQFMSVALLSNLKDVIEVSDELEAFLYVLIYYAVRYLKSNSGDLTVALFLDDFFDTYNFEHGNYTCGPTKDAAISKGQLNTVVFPSPMDTIIKDLLRWFQSLYRVTAYECAIAAGENQTPSPPPQDSSLLPAFEDPGVDEDPTLPGSIDLSDEEDEMDNVPSPKDYQNAEKVRSHSAILHSLKKLLGSSRWKMDKEGDKVPADWKLPDKLCIPAMDSARRGFSSFKRAKVTVEANSAPAFAMVSSLPSLPLANPRRRGGPSRSTFFSRGKPKGKGPA
ncbi:hypothetical protein C8Q80DRAFT_1253690 [Daedaleopsis nitida]|nr:hypothetical protein C8Q80DRAFT_1253690 [Daedaleopsis nitida]